MGKFIDLTGRRFGRIPDSVDRIRNRPEFALWATFGMGSVPNSLRRVGRPLPAK